MKRIRGLSAVWFLTFAIVAAVAITWSVEAYATSEAPYDPNARVTICAPINYLDEESYDRSILFANAGGSYTVTDIGCRCFNPLGGTCTVVAKIEYFNENGDALWPALTCTDDGVAAAWQSVRGQDPVTHVTTIEAGQNVIWSVNDTPATTETNNYLICIKYIPR